jgi:branched-subunit amino acid aminotransferase/4-amino-4-deoxychorismate lyase
VFISSTNRTVIGVGEIAGHPIANSPGPVTRRLGELFEAYIDEYVSRRMSTTAR